MVTTGPYSWSLRPNYLGDWLRWVSTVLIGRTADDVDI